MIKFQWVRSRVEALKKLMHQQLNVQEARCPMMAMFPLPRMQMILVDVVLWMVEQRISPTIGMLTKFTKM